MPRCEKCNAKIKWSKIYWSFWKLIDKTIQCENCGTEQHVIYRGMVITFFTIWAVHIVVSRYLGFKDNKLLELLVFFITGLLASLFIPFIVKLKVKNE